MEGIGNKKNVTDDDDTANQMRMIEAYFGKNSIHEFVPKNAIAVSYFSGGARIWFRDQRYGPKGVSVSTIIANEELEDKVVTDELTETEEQAAREIIDYFKNVAENISNAVEFISWFYGVHVPIVVFGFNKALRAIDCRDREHIITHQFIVVSDSHGADNEKQIAGRSKASKGEMMRLNFDVSNDDENFKVTIASNVSLDDAATLENLPYQNEIDPENGKRKVGADVKEAVRRKQVLSKAAKRYEPKANGMRAPDEIAAMVLNVDNGDNDVLTIKRKRDGTFFKTGMIQLHLLTVAEDKPYQQRELINSFQHLLAEGSNEGYAWIRRTIDEFKIVTRVDDTFYINKNREYVIV